MQRPEIVTRNFHKPDEEVLQQSDVKLASFIENKSQFVDRFTQLADPFTTEWAAATTTARSIAPDYASLASQSSETDALKALINQGCNLFQTLILYVRLAFPDDASVLRVLVNPNMMQPVKVSLSCPNCYRMLLTRHRNPNTKQH